MSRGNKMDEIALTDDISLCELTVRELPQLAEAINHPTISANTMTIPFPYTLSDAEKLLEVINQKKSEAGFTTNFMIKKNQTIVGSIGLICQDGYDSHRTEMGYWVTPKVRGRGIATTAVGGMVKYAFESLSFIRLEATIFPANVGSQKVLEKNGFLREGLLRKYMKKNNELCDVYYYSKLHPSIK